MIVKVLGKKKIEPNPEKMRVVNEVREAERECATARSRFEEALDAEEIDYAIYSLEAAEKKLDILLRKAKLMWGKFEHNKDEDWGLFM